jgi:hypothetical protein
MIIAEDLLQLFGSYIRGVVDEQGLQFNILHDEKEKKNSLKIATAILPILLSSIEKSLNECGKFCTK